MSERLLGDHVEDIAKKLKMDKLMEQIEKLTKQKCNCGGRKTKLNRLHLQMRKLMSGEE